MSRFNTPGPKPGSDRAVRQHKAVAAGYVLPEVECSVVTHQPETETGKTHAPGLTPKRKG